MIVFLFIFSLFSECSFDIHNFIEYDTVWDVDNYKTIYEIEGNFVMDYDKFNKAIIITTKKETNGITLSGYNYFSTLRAGKTVKICYQYYEDFDDLLDCFCRDKELGYSIKKFLKWVSEHFSEIDWHSMRR